MSKIMPMKMTDQYENGMSLFRKVNELVRAVNYLLEERERDENAD